MGIDGRREAPRDGGGSRNVLVVGHSGVLGMELLAVRDMFEVASLLAVSGGGWPEPTAAPAASAAPADPAASDGDAVAPYRVTVCSLDGEPLDIGRGLSIGGVSPLRGYPGPVDTVAVIGGIVAPDVAATDSELVAAIREVAGRSRRVVSTCSGAFLLAAAGVLDGRRATTHWYCGERLQAEHPCIDVDTDAIYVRDGDVWTSAGVTAAHDLVLALIEDDLGPEVALAVARQIVVYLRRHGGQTQFSVQLTAPPARRRPIREVQDHIVANPGADLSLAALAARVHLSPRHFARLFRSEVGMSPGAYVERVRLEAARRTVECTDLPLATVAAETGFGTGENLRRVFVSELGVCPADYRRRFGLRTAAALPA
jgi:transcriptional regulator GlxA family with amidase domain